MPDAMTMIFIQGQKITRNPELNLNPATSVGAYTADKVPPSLSVMV